MNLKQEMVAYFQLPQVNGLILEYLSKHDLSYQSLSDEELMNILDQLQILDPLLNKIQQPSYQQPLDEFGITTYSKTLKVTLERGRGFKEWRKKSPTDKFYISVCGFDQKFRTNSYPLSEKFSIGEQFNFQTSLEDLKPNSSEQLHLMLVILNKEGKREINSVKLIEWRYVLSQGAISFEVELASYHHEGLSELPVTGIIGVKLHLYPLSKLNVVTEKSIERELEFEKKNKEKQNNTFYNYANLYWNEYKAINKNFQSRRIKIYGDSEDKVLIPLNRFVYPLYNVRGIDSPQHALRFCSLIPFQQQKLNKPTINKRFHSIIVGMEGSVEDHANLLCSLLLGFGLKSYVALGQCSKGDHAWVITEDTKNGSLIFWESTKGAKYDYYSHKTYNFYKSIHVVYNHNQYYANIQLDDSVVGTKYNFKDGTMWKKMDQSFLEPTPLHNRSIALSTPTYDVIKMQNGLQNALCQNIGQFRKINKLGFSRDKILSSILSTALINYETERVTGLTFCQDDFQNAIKNYIPSKHTFKAFPYQLTTLDPAIIMETLKNQPKCRQIMLIKGDNVHFAIKCKLIVYPDNIFALWISIGVRYFKIT